MDNSKINQAELEFVREIGDIKLNVHSGRLIYTKEIVSLGLKTYALSVVNVYNSKYSNSSGIKWKLNIEQYLYKLDSKYYYVDGTGKTNEFANIDSNEYYDTSGIGLKLKEYDDHIEITDIANNKMIFRNNKLVETISCENISIVKKIEYENNNILTYYDSRKPDTKITFRYNLDNQLSEIIAINKNKETYRLKYYYDNNNLIKISKLKNGVEKTIWIYEYLDNELKHIADVNSKSVVKIEYCNDKVNKVSIGVSNILKNNMIDKCNTESVGNDAFFGEESYVGDGSSNLEYKIQDIEEITYNKLEYFNNYTIVENEKKLKMIYYLNQEGYTVSILESLDNDNKDLRTLKKMPGKTMIDCNAANDDEKINTQNAYLINTADIISTNEDSCVSMKLGDIDYYRGNTCPNYINYICSFWLKILDNIENPYVKLIVNSEFNNKTKKDYKIVSFDRTLINGWQEVRIPITITYEGVTSVELEFLDNNKNHRIKLVDMKLMYASKLSTKLTDGNSWEDLDNATRIKYTAVSGEEKWINLSDTTIITEKDLQLTYLNKFVLYGNDNALNSYPLYFNDGIKKIMVRKASIYVNNKEFEIKFITDNYTEEFNLGYARASYYNETISQDGDVYIYAIPYFVKNYNANGSTQDVTMTITEANHYVKTATKHTESKTIQCTDLKGKTIFECDEYGVQVFNKYDSNGVLCERKITNVNNPNEYIIQKTNTTDQTITTNNEITICQTHHDGENIVKKEINGVNDIQDNKLIEQYEYDFYNENMNKISNNYGGNNFITYDQCGRVLEMSPKQSSDPNYYSFKFKYNKYGDPSQFFYSYRVNDQIVDNLLIDKLQDRNIGKTTTVYHMNDTSEDTMESTVDKYGRVKENKINNSKITYERDQLWESPGAANVNKIIDELDNKTHTYEYDDFYKLKKYGYVDDNGTIVEVSKTSETTTLYKEQNTKQQSINLTRQESTTYYDDEKLLNPRLDTNKLDVVIAEIGLSSVDSSYWYDDLGRVSQKSTFLTEGWISKDTRLIETRSFKNKTGQLTSKNYQLKDIRESIPYQYNEQLSYSNKGNLSEKSIYYSSFNKSESYKYTYQYNTINQLIKEINTRTNKQIEYTYNNDGGINSVITNDQLQVYNYDNTGRLCSVSTNNQDDTVDYDNMGNVVRFGSSHYAWSRGNVLTSYTKNNKTTNYYFSGLGKKYKKELANGQTITYNYDNNKLMSEYHSDGTSIKYLYDSEGIMGMIILYDGYSSSMYLFVKDEQGNVVSILGNGKELCQYEYDAYGNCTIIKDDASKIGQLNPIRWKGMYCETESNLYITDTSTYSPELRQTLTMQPVEDITDNVGTIYSIYPYTIGNDPINFTYEEKNVNSDLELVYDPPSKTKFKRGWDNFWRSPAGKTLAILLCIIAVIISSLTNNLHLFLSAFISVGVSLFVGGMITGIQSQKTGKCFWNGFFNYINDNWSQTLAIEMTIYIVSLGIKGLIHIMTDCFTKGTLVLTSIGLVNIEDIKVGDKVYSYNEKTKQKELQEVKHLFRKKTNKWVHLQVKANKQVETITCTPNHRIYIKNKGWIKASEIVEKDILILYNGKEAKVINKEIEELQKEEETYNFEVEDNHNYYVTSSSVLVHNDCIEEQICERGSMPNRNARGQKHHVIGNIPFRAFEKKFGKGILKRNDYMVRAFELNDHHGYQEWHVNLDKAVVKAVEKSQTVLEFERRLNEIYKSSELISKFGKIRIVFRL